MLWQQLCLARSRWSRWCAVAAARSMRAVPHRTPRRPTNPAPSSGLSATCPRPTARGSVARRNTASTEGGFAAISVLPIGPSSDCSAQRVEAGAPSHCHARGASGTRSNVATSGARTRRRWMPRPRRMPEATRAPMLRQTVLVTLTTLMRRLTAATRFEPRATRRQRLLTLDGPSHFIPFTASTTRGCSSTALCTSAFFGSSCCAFVSASSDDVSQSTFFVRNASDR